MEVILDFSLSAGIVITVILIFLLSRKRATALGASNDIMIVFYVIVLLVFISYYAFLHDITFLLYVTYIIVDASDVIVGPIFLLYVRSLIDQSPIQWKRVLKHFLFPILFIIGFSIPSFIAFIRGIDSVFLSDKVQDYSSLAIVYSIVYCFKALTLVKRSQRLIKHNYSDLEDKDLVWVRHFLMGTIAVLFVDLTTTFYELIFGEVPWNIGYLTALPLVFLIAYLSYHGLIQSSILLPVFLKEKVWQSDQETEVPTATSKPLLDESEMSKLRVQLEEVIQHQKPHLQSDLTLHALAILLPTTSKKLSALLNQYMNDSFYDYINRLRVEEVKQKMSQPDFQKYSLLGIAYDCGFNSKTSFNRIFKNVTGFSPSAYKNRLN